MMKFNALVLLSVLFAAILICSTTVAQKSEDEKNALSGNHQETNGVKEPAQYSRCRYGCCRWSPYGCQFCCRPGEKVNEGNEETTDVKDPEQIGRPRPCRHGCCRRGPYGCIRCCTSEKADVKEPEQSGRPRPCRYGCCRRGPYGCIRCCTSENEAEEIYAASGDGNKVTGTDTANP